MHFLKNLCLFISLLVLSFCTNNTTFESQDQHWIWQKQLIKEIIKRNYPIINNDTIKVYHNGLKHSLLDTILIEKTLVQLIYNDQNLFMNDGYFLKLEKKNSKVNYELTYSNNSKAINGSVNISEISILALTSYPTAYLYLKPLNIDGILKRIFFDLEMNFWIRTNQNEKLIVLDNFNQSVNSEINNYHLTNSKEINKISYILSSKKGNKDLNIRLESIDKKIVGLFHFKKLPQGYFLIDKKILIK